MTLRDIEMALERESRVTRTNPCQSRSALNRPLYGTIEAKKINFESMILKKIRMKYQLGST